MSDSLTLYSPILDYSSVVRYLTTLENITFQVEGNANSWRGILVSCRTSTIQLTSMQQVTPGDQFSKLVLSTNNFFRRINTTAITNRDMVRNVIMAAEMAIGMIVTPGFDDSPEQSACGYGIAHELGALIFNDSAMYNS